jgi:hypothetical protein
MRGGYLSAASGTFGESKRRIWGFGQFIDGVIRMWYESKYLIQEIQKVCIYRKMSEFDELLESLVERPKHGAAQNGPNG